MAAKKAEDMVKFKISKGASDLEREDVFVAVNGKPYIIKRGITMEMPRSVVEVLENAEEQMDYAISIQEENQYKQIAAES